MPTNFTIVKLCIFAFLKTVKIMKLNFILSKTMLYQINLTFIGSKNSLQPKIGQSAQMHLKNYLKSSNVHIFMYLLSLAFQKYVRR